VKEWVKNNIDRWEEEAPNWLKIEMIPDDFLPTEVLVAEGGVNRTRSTVTMREIVAIPTVEPANQDGRERAIASPSAILVWRTFAEEVYENRSPNHKSNYTQLRQIFIDNNDLLAPVLTRCPKFRTILSFVLVDSFGGRVRKVDRKANMIVWTNEDCEKVGNSLATFIRKREKGEAAVKAWRYHYKQLDILFDELEGW